MKILGFQGKWPMVWPHSWYSWFKWYHIMHKGASWNGKQFFKRGFSFSSHKIIIFHFSSAKNRFFYDEPTKSLLQNCTAPFKKYIRPHFMYNWLNGSHSKAFDPPLIELTKFCWFSRNRVKFERKVPHSLHMIFSKKHF